MSMNAIEVTTPWGIIEEPVAVPSAWGRFSFRGPEAPEPQVVPYPKWTGEVDRKVMDERRNAHYKSTEEHSRWKSRNVNDIGTQFANALKYQAEIKKAYEGSQRYKYKLAREMMGPEHKIRIYPRLTISGQVLLDLTVDGVKVDNVINIDTFAKRQRLEIGDYGNRTKYPIKKSGEYSWDKAAVSLLQYVATVRARWAHNQRIAENRLPAERLNKEFKIESYQRTFEATSDPEKPVRFYIPAIGKTMTEDQARRVYKYLKKEGLI